MALYDLVRDLPLRVDAYELDPHELYVRPEFTRQTTVVRLLGDGEEGLGEDVTYDGPLQEAQQQRGPVLPLAGEWTIDSFSRRANAAASAAPWIKGKSKCPATSGTNRSAASLCSARR